MVKWFYEIGFFRFKPELALIATDAAMDGAVPMAGVEHGAKPEGWTRFVCISDTHGQHNKMTHPIPAGDVLIHAGDFTNTGELSQIKSLAAFLGTLPHEHKVVIAGNHGTCCCGALARGWRWGVCGVAVGVRRRGDAGGCCYWGVQRL